MGTPKQNTLLLHRLNRIQGQIEGLKRVFLKPKSDCVLTMRQVKATQSALKAFAEAYVSEYARTCIPDKTAPHLKKNIENIISSAFTL